MSKLVQELKQDHVNLVNVLNEIKQLGISSKEAQSKLMSAKEGLLAHLKKEDEQLYPVLHKAAEQDDALKRTLSTFAKEMEEISSFALDFFQKYQSGGEGFDFAKDFGKLLAGLGSRIRREENILYSAYDRINP